MAFTFRGNIVGSDILVGWVSDNQVATIVVSCCPSTLEHRRTRTKTSKHFRHFRMLMEIRKVALRRTNLRTTNSSLDTNIRVGLCSDSNGS